MDKTIKLKLKHIKMFLPFLLTNQRHARYEGTQGLSRSEGPMSLSILQTWSLSDFTLRKNNFTEDHYNFCDEHV